MKMRFIRLFFAFLLAILLPVYAFSQCTYPMVNDIVIEMEDSYGDGWNGNYYYIYNSAGSQVASGTITAWENGGNWDNDNLSLAPGNYTISVNGGAWQYEVSWEIINYGTGVTLASGGAPTTNTSFYVGPVDDPTPSDIIVNTDGEGCSDEITLYTYQGPNSQTLYNSTIVASQDIGFPFTFFGEEYTTVRLSADGYLTFDPDAPSTFGNINNEPDLSIMFPFHNMMPNYGGNAEVTFGTIGQAPNRIFIATFYNAPMFSCVTSYSTQQVRLHEGSNKIETFINQKPICNNFNGGAATHGLRSGDDAVYVPGRNASVWEITANAPDAKEFIPNGTDDYIINDIPYSPIIGGDITWYDDNQVEIGEGASLTVYPSGPTSYEVLTSIGSTICGTETVTVSPGSVPAIAIDTAIICEGSTVELDAGDYDSYAWDTGDTTQVITVNSGGVYNLSATSSNGCVVSGEAVVNSFPVPDIFINNITAICLGDSIDLSTLNVEDNNNTSGSNSWHSGTPATALNELSSTVVSPTASTTSYYVKKTTDNGCSDELEVSILAHALPTSSLTDLAICSGDTAILYPGEFTNYIWNDNSSNDTLLAFTQGGYSVEVTDNNGCSIQDSIYLTVNDLPTIDLADESICQGESTLLDAGSFSSYLWNTMEISSNIDADTEGYYFVDVTDANNCTTRDSLYLTVHPLPTPNLSDSAFCFGDSAILNPGSFDYYDWNTGASSTNITVSSTGNYSVEVTDSNNCSNVASSTITVHSLPVIALTDLSICAGNSTVLDPGSFDTYLWNTTETSQTIEVSTAGYYGVEVTDLNNCSSIDSIFLSVYSAPSSGLTDTAICFGDTITLDAGIFNSYLWNNDSTTASIEAAIEGDYAVTITDANNCSSTDSIYLTVHALPTPTLEAEYAFCDEDSVQLNPGAFSDYLWNSTMNTDTLNVFAAGAIDVLVTDSNGCQNTANTNITVYALPVPVLNATPLCEGDSLTLDPGLFSDYLWSTADTTQTITVGSNENFSVTVSNSDGCSQSTDVDIVVNPLPVPVLSDSTICDGEIVTLNPGLFANYDWSTTASTASINVGTSGTYSVTVTDINGCVEDTTAIITVNSLPSPILSNVQFCAGDSALLYPGNFDSYEWNTLSTDSSIYVYTTGNYAVIVTDENGCQNQANSVVTAYTLPNPTLADEEICEGENTVLNAGMFAAYQWSTGATTQQLTVSNAGVYGILVTDGNGCQDTAVATVNVNSLPNPQITALDSLCFNAPSELLTATPIAGLYAGDGVINNSAFSPSAAGVGTHEVCYTFIDGNNCSNTDTIQVVVNPSPTPFAGIDESVCGLSYILNANNNPSITGAWNVQENILYNNIDTSTTAVLVPDYGVHSFVWKELNEFGCSSTDEVSINFNIGSTVFAGNDLSICPGDTVRLIEATAENYQTFDWTSSGSGTFLANEIITGYVPSTADINASNITLSLSLENTPCPVVTDTINLSIKPRPAATLSGETDICEHDVASTLYINFTGTPPFHYTINEGESMSSNGLVDSLSINEAGNYSLTYLDDQNCTGPATASLNIISRPIPIAEFSASPYEVDMHDPSIHLSNLSELAETFLWDFGNGVVDSLIYHPVHVYDSVGTYTISLKVVSEYGCIDSITREVIVNSIYHYYVPDAFTPDKDGLNETFIGVGSGYQDFRMAIYTRWGELVYQTDDDQAPWDGTYQNNGSPAPTGLYFYQINFRDEGLKPHSYTGEVSLIR